MSFATLLREQLVIERAYPGVIAATSTTPERPVLDDYHQPVIGWATLATVAGLIQPRAEREAVSQDQGGATVTDAVIYLQPTDVLPKDRVRRADEPTGPWYELTGVRDAAGAGHHLECDAQLVA